VTKRLSHGTALGPLTLFVQDVSGAGCRSAKKTTTYTQASVASDCNDQLPWLKLIADTKLLYITTYLVELPDEAPIHENAF
jgi:hypothetical protein